MTQLVSPQLRQFIRSKRVLRALLAGGLVTAGVLALADEPSSAGQPVAWVDTGSSQPSGPAAVAPLSQPSSVPSWFPSSAPSLVPTPIAGQGVWRLEQKSYSPGMSQLVGITETTGAQPIRVLAQKGKKPAPGVVVEFRIVGAPAKSKGARLSLQRVITDGKGLASVELVCGDKAGDYLVAAYLDGSVQKAPAVITRTKAMTPAWITFLVFGLMGGLGLFLYGMGLMGENLQKVAGKQLRIIIRVLARNRFLGVLMGSITSGILQSSSAASVMVVGFVSAGMMTLTQAISVVIGTKVGVTVTVQLIAFNLSDYALAMIGIGVVLTVAAGKRERMSQIGAIILGFGLLFFGLSLMSGAMKPLRGMPEFAGMLLNFGESPGLAIIVSTAFTSIIQSSIATVAMCMALAAEGLMPLEAALPLSIGSTIGTCTTALLASLGGTRDGKRVAVAHLVFSVAAAAVCYPFLGLLCDLAREFSSMMGSEGVVRQIANGFMLYSIVTAIVFLPFVKVIELIVLKLLPPSKAEVPFGPRYINDASLGVPVMALDQAQKEVERMAEILGQTLKATAPAIAENQKEKISQLECEDEKLAILERAIRRFLTQVAQKGLSKEQSTLERALIYLTEDLEAAGHLLRHEVLHFASAIAATGSPLSPEDLQDLTLLSQKLEAKFDRVYQAIQTGDKKLAEQVLQLSFKEKQLTRKLRDAHLERVHCDKDNEIHSSGDYLSILSGLSAIGSKFDSAAEEILREM